MAEMQLQYSGEFISRAGVRYRAEIWHKASAPYDEVGTLTFEADEPLTIEWAETEKEDVICASTATLQVESPGDRTYIDLYTEDPGAVRLDVYREGALYWSGTLDTEQYEEPYERGWGYVVSLSFGDFGLLDRLKWDGAGYYTLAAILALCVERAGILTGGTDAGLITTSVDGGDTCMDLEALSVRADNFYDEDGEPSTLEEVLEGAFQPLGLRVVQKAGKVWVYDLNGLYTQGAQAEAVWSGDSQTLGVDKVYNNVKITWSPYAQTGNLAPDTCWTEEIDESLTNLDSLSAKTYGNCNYYSYPYTNDSIDYVRDTSTDPDREGEELSMSGFTLWLSKNGENAEPLDYFTSVDGDRTFRPLFFKTVEQYAGEEAEGIAVMYPAAKRTKGESETYEYTSMGGNEYTYTIHKNAYISALDRKAAPVREQDPDKVAEGDTAYYDILQGNAYTPQGQKAMFRSAKISLPPVADPSAVYVRIKLELLADPRVNYTEEAEDQTFLKMKNWQDTWKAVGNFLYVPVRVCFQPEGSDTYICWENGSVCAMKTDTPIRDFANTLGYWNETKYADGSDPYGFLAYYAVNDGAPATDDSGVAKGWAANRQAVNPHKKSLSARITEGETEGQAIPYPTVGGKSVPGKLWLEVVGRGWQVADAGVSLSTEKVIDSNNLLKYTDSSPFTPKLCWLMFKLPEIAIVDARRPWDEEIEDEDVEYSAELNPQAKEELELDTVCGTADGGVPTARGAYFKTDTGGNLAQATTLTRAGRTAQAEELLIGTLYSQYAARKTKLEGEMRLSGDALCAYTERNQQDGGKDILFLLTGETQDLIADTTDATLVELRPDEYDKAEE